jgi:CHASE3 domain sensor protein
MSKEEQRRLQSKAARERTIFVRTAITLLAIGAAAAWTIVLLIR